MDDQGVGLVLVGIVGLASLAFFGLYVWSLVWAYGDAERRGKSGCLVALLIAVLSWPLSLVLWYVARPEGGQRDGRDDGGRG